MSTFDDSFATVQPSKPRGGRFRFSLRAMLLTIALVCLVASHFYTSWQLQRARDEVRQLRHEVGALTIDDPSRLHVVALKDTEDLTWRWRVYVPKDRQFRLHVALHDQIPKDGFPRWQIRPSLPAGEYTLTVAIRKDQQGKWHLSALRPTGAIGTTISEDRMQWLVAPDHSSIGTTAGVTETESVAQGKPLVLMRSRAMKRTGEGGAATDSNPTDGIMVWIDEGDPDD